MAIDTKYYVTDLVKEVGSLPSVAAQIVSLASEPECNMNSLSRIILSDSVMSMRFMSLANSAALSTGQEIKNLQDALVRLGLRRVRNIALCMGMHDMVPAIADDGSFDMVEFWKHSLATASCAQGLTRTLGGATGDDAWLAGILQGIGIAALHQKTGSSFYAALDEAQAKKITLAEAEMLVMDFHHGELGARILSQWSLPAVFVQAIEFLPENYDPDEVSKETNSLIEILRCAVQIVRAIGFGNNGDGDNPANPDQIAIKIGLSEEALTCLVNKVNSEVDEMSQLVGIDIPQNSFSQYFEQSKQQIATLGLEGFDETLAREKLEQQLSMAREIQQRLLPTNTPQISGFTMAADNHPSLHVSGDYYDFIKIKGNRIGLVVADVAGKGMPAALLASNLQASLRALGQVFNNPGELLAAVNESLVESTNEEMFATLFLAVLNLDGSGFEYASAGHNPPLLLRADNSVDWLKPSGTPLGMFPGTKYLVKAVPMSPGDLLAIYTDGITEAPDQQNVEFSQAGLLGAVRQCLKTTCPDSESLTEKIISSVFAAVLEHTHNQGTTSIPKNLLSSSTAHDDSSRAADDLTMIVLQS